MIKKIKELYRRRELIFSLAAKDLKARYKNAVIGFGWTLLNPLVLMVTFYVIFGLIFPITRVENYPLFLLCGLFPWTFFTASLSEATTSIVANANLIRKTYFPREVIPISISLANLVNFLLSLVILFAFILIFRIKLSLAILWLPLIILIQLIFTIGLSLIVSSLHVCYRDVRYLMDILLRVWFFATPIIYSLSHVKNRLPSKIFPLYLLNPMTGITIAYHNIFLYRQGPDPLALILAAAVSVLTLIMGFFTFRKYERIFADMV
ncbi:ABC transporter permease [bacterium]|nr:ABC transporter permease [bacterium]